jgi:hypothetical protein
MYDELEVTEGMMAKEKSSAFALDNGTCALFDA